VLPSIFVPSIVTVSPSAPWMPPPFAFMSIVSGPSASVKE
jgi:hypothetical protein